MRREEEEGRGREGSGEQAGDRSRPGDSRAAAGPATLWWVVVGVGVGGGARRVGRRQGTRWGATSEEARWRW